MNILFFDPVSPHGYTSNSLTTRPMGASEASLMRVARALAAIDGYSVSVYQQADPDRNAASVQGVKHLNQHCKFEPDVIVHQRTAQFIEDMRLEFPKAKHIVWLHDAAGDWLKDEPLEMVQTVCVSRWHFAQISLAINDTGKLCHPDSTFIYNPIDLDNVAPETKVKGRLGFFSSPQKGLAQVVDIFAKLKVSRPKLELVVANPGYLPDVVPEGVRFLGQLPHPMALKELSKCQVLFYPQTVFPETFGCVLAEANAVGVPVLSHDFGAAKEVLVWNSANHVLDCSKPKNMQKALEQILLGSDSVISADPRFSIERITKEWKQLLEGTHEAPTVSEPRQGG